MSEAEKARPSGRRRIYLLRHGAVKYFDKTQAEKNYYEVELTAAGRDQARRVGEFLQSVPVDVLFSSPVGRCVQTATLVRPTLEVETVEQLREIAPGDISQLEAPTALLQVFRDIDAQSQFLGGESFGAVRHRAREALDLILARDNWQSALVVAHEVMNRSILAEVLGADYHSYQRIEQDECCLNIIDIDEYGECFIRLQNYMAYNPLSENHLSRSMERVYRDYITATTAETRACAKN
jgi:probable phosphoglycerate mutase